MALIKAVLGVIAVKEIIIIQKLGIFHFGIRTGYLPVIIFNMFFAETQERAGILVVLFL
jgi:hypothetical protein